MIIEMLNYKEFEKAKALLEQHGLIFDVYSNATDCYLAQEIDFHLEIYADNEEVEISDQLRKMVYENIHLNEPLEYEVMQELVYQTVNRCLQTLENEDEEIKIEHIAHLVEQGYTSGYDPDWSIDIEEDEHLEEDRLAEIARLIREGCTSGYYPTWSLTIQD